MAVGANRWVEEPRKTEQRRRACIPGLLLLTGVFALLTGSGGCAKKQAAAVPGATAAPANVPDKETMPGGGPGGK